VLVACVALVSVRALAAGQFLLLEVFLNGSDTHRIVRFDDRDGALYATPADLALLGLAIPSGLTPDSEGMVPLASLHGVTGKLDFATQSVAIAATPSALRPTILEAAPAAPVVRGEATPGLLLDYDLLGTISGPVSSASGFFDVRAFNRLGVLESTGVGYANYGPGLPDFVRLDTNVTHDDPAALRRWIAGDFVSGALSWTRAVRMGGIQVATDFALRPDLVTFPVPVVSGQAAVPTTAEVLVNGVQSFNGSVNAGPFAIRELPVVTGAGDVTLVLRNALGQQVTTTLPLYASVALLRPGLSQYSIEAGAVRQNYGLASNDYGAAAVSASWRYGATDWLTLETHAEGTNGAADCGAGAVVRIGTLGVLNLALAGSAGGAGGVLGSIGFQRQGRAINLAVSFTAASAGYRDIASVNGTPVPQSLLLASLGLSLGRAGSIGLA
jgi:outer membrane usher protein